MSELRYDPVFDVWTVIAEQRLARPVEFVQAPQLRNQLICPFCAGNEEETPPALHLLDSQGKAVDDLRSPGWSSRVVPNLYPTFNEHQREDDSATGPWKSTSAHGAQELIIPTPRHISSISEMTVPELGTAFRAAQHRIACMSQSGSIAHAMLFMNCRPEAGASIDHIHFQLIGAPITGTALQARIDRMDRWKREQGVSLLESIRQFELQDSRRIACETDSWVALCPYASRTPFHLWIIPKPVIADGEFCDLQSGPIDELSQLSINYIARLETLVADPGYNWMLHQSPFSRSSRNNWFIEILPRLSRTAGFELGTGIDVNPVSPESAARRLRKVG